MRPVVASWGRWSTRSSRLVWPALQQSLGATKVRVQYAAWAKQLTFHVYCNSFLAIFKSTNFAEGRFRHRREWHRTSSRERNEGRHWLDRTQIPAEGLKQLWDCEGQLVQKHHCILWRWRTPHRLRTLHGVGVKSQRLEYMHAETRQEKSTLGMSGWETNFLWSWTTWKDFL